MEKKDQSNEINIFNILELIYQERKTLLSFIAFFFFVTYLYFKLSPNEYFSEITFSPPADSNIFTVNNHQDILKEGSTSLYKRFLTKFTSKKVQIEVLKKNKEFLSLYKDNYDKFKYEFLIDYIKKIEKIIPKVNNKDNSNKIIFDPLRFSYSFINKDENVVTSFLRDLYIESNNLALVELKEDLKSLKKSKILELESSYRIASSLAIEKSNFGEIAFYPNESIIPEWFLYGSKALLKEKNELLPQTDSYGVNFDIQFATLDKDPTPAKLKPSRKFQIYIVSLVLGFIFGFLFISFRQYKKS